MACLRIISQDGTVDIPYEQVIIQRYEKKIYFLNKNLVSVEQLVSDIEMASYSTEEKAKKAMEMLREEYRFEKLFETLCSGMGDYPNKPFYYFQFPKDEDVEV